MQEDGRKANITRIYRIFWFKVCLRKQTLKKANFTKKNNHLFNCIPCFIIIVFMVLYYVKQVRISPRKKYTALIHSS